MSRTAAAAALVCLLAAGCSAGEEAEPVDTDEAPAAERQAEADEPEGGDADDGQPDHDDGSRGLREQARARYIELVGDWDVMSEFWDRSLRSSDDIPDGLVHDIMAAIREPGETWAACTAAAIEAHTSWVDFSTEEAETLFALPDDPAADGGFIDWIQTLDDDGLQFAEAEEALDVCLAPILPELQQAAIDGVYSAFQSPGAAIPIDSLWQPPLAPPSGTPATPEMRQAAVQAFRAASDESLAGMSELTPDQQELLALTAANTGFDFEAYTATAAAATDCTTDLQVSLIEEHLSVEQADLIAAIPVDSFGAAERMGSVLSIAPYSPSFETVDTDRFAESVGDCWRPLTDHPLGGLVFRSE